MAFDDELQLNAELKRTVEIFLKKTKLKDVDTAVQKFCQVADWKSARRDFSPFRFQNRRVFCGAKVGSQRASTT